MKILSDRDYSFTVAAEREIGKSHSGLLCLASLSRAEACLASERPPETLVRRFASVVGFF